MNIDNPVLKESGLFDGLTEEEMQRCLQGASPEFFKIKKRETFILPDRFAELYLLLSGRVNVIQDSGMNNCMVHVLKPGRWFGIGLCINVCEKPHRHHYFAASEDAEILKISYNGLLNQKEFEVQILKNLLRLVASNLSVLAEKINHTQSKSVRSKISVFLRDQMLQKETTEFRPDFTRQGLADYLNISYPAMLREFSKMEKEGILQVKGDCIRILDQEALIIGGSEYNIF